MSRILKTKARRNVTTWDQGAHVMPVYLRMEKPLRASGKGYNWNEIEFEGEILSTKDLLYIAKERGCDSIIIKNVHDRAHGKGRPSTIVAVFNPDQIKSAMTNTGAYGTSHNIDEGITDGGDFQTFWEMTNEVAQEMVAEYERGSPRHPWKVVPANRLIAIWKQATKDGFVRDEKGLNEIANRMINNTQRLCINTELASYERGRTKLSLEQIMNNLDIEVDDPEKFVAWAIGLPSEEVRFDCEQMRISDYGLKPLINYAARLLVAKDDKEKMTIIDLMLQISHQRSDLASWFVEGGAATLARLFKE